MKKTIGNLALVAGVIVSSLAAGESQRVSRAAAVSPELVGQVLHTAVKTEYETEQPDALLVIDRGIEAGTVLTDEHVSWLSLSGFDQVLVLRRAKDAETVPVGEEALGKVLATPVTLTAEPEQIPMGRQITAGFVERMVQAGLSAVTVSTEVRAAEMPPERRELRWNLLDEGANPGGSSLVGSTLREEISLPFQLRTASYVDPSILERLEASGVSEVSVKIPRTWTWQDWGSRWWFAIGIGITVLGIALKRARPDAQAIEAGALQVAHLGQLICELEGRLESLVSRSEELDADTIHREVDPLLAGPVYAIADGRESIRSAHGARVFAAVMDAFARGERKLNRAWSAAVDGHGPEARASLAAALPALREAREALPGTRPPGPAGFDDEPGGAPLPPDVPLTPGGDPWSHET